MSKLYTADKFVTIGGTTSQYVTGTGSLVTFPTIPSGADYIQNQIASAQSANMWISGNAIINGNIGVGVSSPSAKIDLGTSGSFKVTQTGITEVYVEGTGVRLKNIYTGTGWARGILTYEDSAGSDYFQLGGYGSGQTFTYAYIGPSYDTAWQVWRGSNVGIGTTNPSERLTIKGSNNTANFGVERSSNTSNVFEIVETADGSGRAYLYDSSGNLDVFLSTDTNVYFNNNGNVGIGTTSPSQKLDVNGNQRISGGLLEIFGGSTYPQLSRSSASGGLIINTSGTVSALSSLLSVKNNSGSDIITMLGNGNVGIGTTSPSQKLVVSGNSLITGTLEIDTLNNGTGDFITATGGGILTKRTAAQVVGDISAEYQVPTNTIRNNLGYPTVREAALFHGQFNNKFRFIVPTLQEESTDGTTWTTSTRASASQLGDMMIGEGQITSFNAIPVGAVGTYGGYRLTWNVVGSTGYVFLDALYVYNSANGNTINLKIERFHNTTGWQTVTGPHAFSNWPGHTYIPHSSTPYSNDPSQYSQVRITFETTHNNNTNQFNIYGIEWFGGYPAGRRNVESYDRDRNVTFPAGIQGSGSLSIRAAATASVATQIPVFTADPSGTTRTMLTRTPAQLRSDIGAQATLTNPITGTGTTNYLSKFTGTTSLGNSLVFDNGTNVGIGTSSPQVKLSVQGAQNNTIAPANGVVKFVGGDAGIFMGTLAGTPNYGSWIQSMRESDGLTFPLHLQPNGGNVGIGTTAPRTKLHIASTSSAIVSPVAGAATNSATIISNSVASYGLNFVPSGNGDIHLQAQRFDGTATLYNINLNPLGGNVGIGTTNPSSVLHLYRNSTTSPLNFSNSSSLILQNPYGSAGNTGTAIFFKSDVGTYNTFAGIGGNMVGSTANGSYGDIVFGTKAAATDTALSERMRINASGNVGIGTTSPNALLNVVGSADMSGTFETNNAGSAASLIVKNGNGTTSALYSYVRFINNNTNQQDWRIGTYSNNDFTFHNAKAATSPMVITTSGNVGIGTTAPATKLHVTGITRIDEGGNTAFYAGNYIRVFNDQNLNIRNSGGTTVANISVSGNSYFNGGNVGIGTTAPNEKLEISGANVKLRFTNTSVGGQNFSIGPSILGVSNEGFSVRDLTNSVDRIVISSAGNVGIGTSAPNAKLDVNGDALINQLTIGQGPVVGQGNTALGKGALGSMVGGKSNIAVGSNANSDNDVTGLTAIGVELNTDTNLDPLGQNCLAISQFNANAYSNQVPHIYVPSSIAVGSSSIEDIITFDINHYVGAFIEYVITTSDGGDFAAGTVTVAWKDSGSGNLKDTRDVVWSSYMDDFDFLLSGTTVQLRNDSAQSARIRISVRAMIRT